MEWNDGITMRKSKTYRVDIRGMEEGEWLHCEGDTVFWMGIKNSIGHIS